MKLVPRNIRTVTLSTTPHQTRAWSSPRLMNRKIMPRIVRWDFPAVCSCLCGGWFDEAIPALNNMVEMNEIRPSAVIED